MNIQWNMKNIGCTKGNIGNCHHLKTSVCLASVNSGFLGMTISNVTILYSQYFWRKCLNIHSYIIRNRVGFFFRSDTKALVYWYDVIYKPNLYL